MEMRKIHQSILVIVFQFQFEITICQLDPNKLNHFPELDGTMIHDVIPKGHGGELTVSTIDGLGTEFLILLPL